MKAIDQFLDSPEIGSLSPATVKALRSDLRNFVKWWEQARQRPFSVRQLVARDIRLWQTYRQ